MQKSSLWYARLYGQEHKGISTDLVLILNQIRAQERQASSNRSAPLLGKEGGGDIYVAYSRNDM